MARDKPRFLAMAAYWLTFWRDVLLVAVQSNWSIVNLDYEAQIYELAERLDGERIYQALQDTRRTMDYLQRNANTRLAIEVLLMDYPTMA
jgi:DNA polymerase-3 subunit delta'